MARRSSKTVTVYNVLCDWEAAADLGYSKTFRFRTESDAAMFARGKTYLGRPATVGVEHDVPKHLAQRWGVI
jgi:hypothetical protein